MRMFLAPKTTYYVVCSFFYVGFLFHSSKSPILLGYSWWYLVFLGVLAFLFLLPTLLSMMSNRYGIKTVFFSVIPSIVLVGVVWAIAHLYYDYTRKYPFDPYLQVQPQPLELQHAKAKTDSTYRILAMGGSTTANSGLPPSQRYCAVLERLLARRYPDRDIQVLNAGRS